MRVQFPPSAPILHKPLILLKAIEIQWPDFALATNTCYKARMSEMEKYPHLYRSGPRGILNFRRAVPPELRPIIGKSEIVVSLKTADLKVGLHAYHEIAHQTDAQFRVAKQRFLPGCKSGMAATACTPASPATCSS